MELLEEKAWFIHNEDEKLWTKKGWDDSFADAMICRTEKEAVRIVEILRVLYPEKAIDCNPIFEVYSIAVTDKADPKKEDYHYTANEELPFTSYYGREKLFFDRERAEKEADRLWFEVFEENPNIEIAVVFAAGDGDFFYPSFSREEQQEWYEKREQEWKKKRGE